MIEESHAPGGGSNSRTATYIHFSRRMLALVVGILVVPWAILLFWVFGSKAHEIAEHSLGIVESGFSPTSASKDVRAEKVPGPWGNLETLPITIELPDEFVFVPPPTQPPIRWFFHGYTKAKAIEFLRTNGMAEGQLDALANKAAWTTTADGAAVVPGDELILGMSPDLRAKVYSVLVEFPENSTQIDPIWFRANELEHRLKQSDWTRASSKLLRRLLYSQGDLLLFADFEPALRQLPDDQERHRFMKTVSRKETLLMRLKIDADSDINAIANYWGLDGRKKDIIPLLRALQRVEKGCKTSIITLLPHFARDHLFTYPYTTTGAPAVKQDCFWSAFNFFNEVPDDRYNNMDYIRELLRSQYYSILEPSQLGDLVFLTTKDETVIHAAAYIAADVVFTKNGEAYTQPWIFMHMNDMLDTYAVRHPQSGPLKVLYFRRKVL
jgi:hypothetical protein